MSWKTTSYFLLVLICLIVIDIYEARNRYVDRIETLKADIFELKTQVFRHSHPHRHVYHDQSLTAEKLVISSEDEVWESWAQYWRHHWEDQQKQFRK
jgi:hypothetical protein